MKTKKIKKKGEISATLTWIVAAFIIFILMMVYLGIVSFMVSERSFFSYLVNNNADKINYQGGASDRLLINSFFAYLNSPLENNGEKTVRDLVDKEDVSEDDLLKFRTLSEGFLDKYIMKDKSSTENSSYTSAWIRIYGLDEKIDMYGYDKKYSKYEAMRYAVSNYGSYSWCGPEKINSTSYDVVLINVFVKDKKIVFCTEAKK